MGRFRRVTLRPGVLRDEATVLRIRNEPGVAAEGLTSAPRGPGWFHAVEPFVHVIEGPTRNAGPMTVGYILLESTAVISIAVSESYRGEGVGTLALQQALARARGRECTRALAWIRPGNAPSMAIFRAAGFCEQPRNRTVLHALALR